MSAFRVIGLDFWNTLYIHSHSPESRGRVRRNAIVESCKALSIQDHEPIAASFFETADNFIKRTWSSGRAPSRNEVVRACIAQFQGRLNELTCRSILEVLENLYLTKIQPRLLPGARTFVEKIASSRKLCVVSDTYFVPGRILRMLMKQDGVLHFFEDLCFSDEMGHKKPSTHSFIMLMRKYGCKPSEFLYIGDDLETDYGAASQLQIPFIHFDRNTVSEKPPSLPSLLGRVQTYGEALELMGVR